MNKQETKLKANVSIGDRLLRLSDGDTDDDSWREFTVNETYLKLIEQFPEDYRQLDGSPLPLCITI
jgi:hypothetical protein